jgi:UDP:flavonoid glycosyltransferase YjiC (YdhE family)
MKLLFSSRPAYGHLYPMMPLAFAARESGHEVVFATAGRFERMLHGLGFPTVSAGISFEEARAQVLADEGESTDPRSEDGRPDLAFAARIFFDVLATRSAADLAPRIDDIAPDIVVYEQGEVGAAVVAGAAGIPAVCHAISPRIPVPALEQRARSYLDRVWASQGVDDPPFSPWDGDAYLDIVPPILQQESFLGHPGRVAMRPAPWSEPGAELPTWIGKPQRPLVYLTLGTVVGSTDALAPAVEALGRIDADVLVALGSATDGTLAGLPGNVHVEPFVDQAALLPHVDLVVHHGGTGTMLGAVVNDCRQVVLPKGADQFFNADALSRTGMASVLEPADATPDAIAAAVRGALEAPVPAAAAVARAQIAAMPPPGEALADVLGRVAVAA